MAIEFTWRWFGPNDPISLQEIKQTGATGIVSALHHIPIGETWTVDEIIKRKHVIEAGGLAWSVVESIPVHESIKKRSPGYHKFIEKYKQSLRNVAHCGIKTVCYNFMPVLDWSRTDLAVTFDDGSITTKFEHNVLIAFDLFVLKRNGAKRDYTSQQIQTAEKYYKTLDEQAKTKLIETILLGFPGSGDAYTLETLRTALNEYADIGHEKLRSNLYDFIREIMPAAQEAGILMAIHPDDPPLPLLGLPRVVSNAKDIDRLLQVFDSPSNGVTLCTGSLGASRTNNVAEIANRFAHRVSFLHLRNVTSTGERDFIEDNHLEGNVDIYAVIKALLLEQQRRKQEGRKDLRIPMRPDHGHLMLADKMLAEHKKQNVYPGYSLFGRMRGIAELRGLEMGIRRSLGLD
ncbi:MAG: mannonate dehydratase [Ignavibacteriae bacterium]|nr:mannonate dehydratase [Ignavibacteriota bacterium]